MTTQAQAQAILALNPDATDFDSGDYRIDLHYEANGYCAELASSEYSYTYPAQRAAKEAVMRCVDAYADKIPALYRDARGSYRVIPQSWLREYGII